MSTTWTTNRRPVAGPVDGLTVTKDGARFVVAERAGDYGHFVCRREGGGLVALYRFGLRRLALAARDELARGSGAD